MGNDHPAPALETGDAAALVRWLHELEHRLKDGGSIEEAGGVRLVRDAITETLVGHGGVQKFAPQEATVELLQRILNHRFGSPPPREGTGSIKPHVGLMPRGIAEGSVAVWIQPPRTAGMIEALLVEVRPDGSLRELA